MYNNKLTYNDENDPKTFYQFLKTSLMQRSHLDLIFSSNASRNEDRFNAILPSWDKYKLKIRNKNTISAWKINEMISVKLKLYEMMDDSDLWNKARLLFACSNDPHARRSILPSFASQYNMDDLYLVEQDDIDKAYIAYGWLNLRYKNDDGEFHIKQLINEYKMNSKLTWTENLISNKLNHHCLFVKSKSYFIMDVNMDKWIEGNTFSNSTSSVENYIVYMPFFTYSLPGYTDVPPSSYGCTGIYLVDSLKNNRWTLYSENHRYGFEPRNINWVYYNGKYRYHFEPKYYHCNKKGTESVLNPYLIRTEFAKKRNKLLLHSPY